MNKPKGIWLTTCKKCAGSISNYGSGRGRSQCDSCRHKQMREYAKPRYHRIKVLTPKRRQKTNREHVQARKIEIGVCFDKLYCHPDLRCTIENSSLFAFDHRDPTQKLFTISNPEGKKWLGPNRPKIMTPHDFDLEIAKCDLVCHNCHAMRTKLGKHHTKRKNLLPELAIVVHPTLWDEVA